MQTILTSWLRSQNDGGAWVAQHKLRHDIFINRMDYNVQTADRLEFDQFDTPRATYIVVMDDDHQRAIACCRLVPTVFPTMVGQLWPELLGGFDLARLGYLEATRIGVRQEATTMERREALGRVIQGVLNYASQERYRGVIGVMPVALFKASLERNGCVIDYLAEPISIDNRPTVAGLIDVQASLTMRAA